MSGFIDNLDVYDIVKRYSVYIYAGLVIIGGMKFYNLLKNSQCVINFVKKIVMK